MRPSRTWAYKLGVLQVVEGDGRLRVETRDFDALRRALGDEIVAGFSRLFVWTDRISSLIHLAYWNQQNLPEDSPAHSRNFQTVLWFACGVLFEAAEAIEQLDEAHVTDHMRSPKHWHELRAMATRWTDNTLLRRTRNNLGFHADPHVTSRGIEALAASGDKVVLVESDDQTTTRSTFRLGLEALLTGMEITVKDFERVIGTAVDDWGRFRELVQHVILEVLRYHEAWPPEPPGPPEETP